MSAETVPQAPRSVIGQPAWEIAQLFPTQGNWAEGDYLALNTNHLVELSDGKLEVLAMPTEWHQDIVLFLYETLLLYSRSRKLGKVLVAPLRIRLWDRKFREPDIVFMMAANKHRRSNRYWNGADLVMEVISDDEPDRDLVTKRAEYAQAGIPEYWIADPRDRTLTVLWLDCATGLYLEFGRHAEGDYAKSRLLPEFTVSVTEVFSPEST